MLFQLPQCLLGAIAKYWRPRKSAWLTVNHGDHQRWREVVVAQLHAVAGGPTNVCNAVHRDLDTARFFVFIVVQTVIETLHTSTTCFMKSSEEQPI